MLQLIWCRNFAALVHHKRAHFRPTELVLKTDGTKALSKLIPVCMKDIDKHREKKASMQSKRKC
jgi:hypothetical protein